MYEITWSDVLASAVFIVLTVGLVRWWKIGLEKTLVIGTLRTFVQLTVMGFLLNWIFSRDNWIFMVCLLTLMILVAAFEGTRRQKNLGIPNLFLILTASLGITTLIVLGTILTFILDVEPWYYPYAMIPIGGMIIGNGLNTATLGINRFSGEMTLRKDEIEMLLSLGASPKDAAQDAFRESVKASLIPTINALMMVGLVQLPGVMTGQILAGADPIIAVRYQVMIMYMWVTVSALAVIMTLMVVSRKFFTVHGQLNQELIAARQT